MKKEKSKYFDRDLSWLSFNYRVLQEAINKEVPLIERLKFLAIYSSNLDEFYRVRVALHRNALDLKIKVKENLALTRKKLLEKIKKTVKKQQTEFGEIYRNVLLPELAANNIFIVDENNLDEEQCKFINGYFTLNVLPELQLIPVKKKGDKPFLENKQLYFALKLDPLQEKSHKSEYFILKIPSDKLPRFTVVPSQEKKHVVIFLDDIIRASLHLLFPVQKIISCHCIKISRDAELFLEDSDNLIEEIRQKLIKRKTNPPSRMLYDSSMPKDFLKLLIHVFHPAKDYMIPGGRYHNFDDFFNFPAPGYPKLKYPEMEELIHKGLEKRKSIFTLISQRDRILHFPYQRYEYVTNFLVQAADDPKVKTIKITLYRVADDSKIAIALLKAAKNGKKVVAFVEVKARFNEISNLYWGQQFTDAGIKVIYSFSELKVHTKLCLVERIENGKTRRYAYLSTGNFNEKTAKTYCDHGYFTSKKQLTNEAAKIFDYFNDRKLEPKFKYLLVAPFNMRNRLTSMIKNEINNAEAGKKALMILKMNSLEDSEIIDMLYDASNAGVKIKIIVRGICCLVPGVNGQSKNIKVISIVDRYLEHDRIFIFYNNGDEQIFVSSADLMSRNLNRRVEAAFPITDENIRGEIKMLIDFELKDNTSARKLNKTQSNPYKKSTSKKKVRAQIDTYNYLKAIA